jgi:hypothetical protein
MLKLVTIVALRLNNVTAQHGTHSAGSASTASKVIERHWTRAQHSLGASCLEQTAGAQILASWLVIGNPN